jgi:hypothetical protein
MEGCKENPIELPSWEVFEVEGQSVSYGKRNGIHYFSACQAMSAARYDYIFEYMLICNNRGSRVSNVKELMQKWLEDFQDSTVYYARTKHISPGETRVAMIVMTGEQLLFWLEKIIDNSKQHAKYQQAKLIHARVLDLLGTCVHIGVFSTNQHHS